MRSRGAVLLLTSVVALIVASGVAIAASVTCQSGTSSTSPCSGTDKTSTQSGDDVVTGTSGPDYITALGGNDQITGNAGNDYTDGGLQSDTYNFTSNYWGADTIVDAGGTDTVKASSAVTWRVIIDLNAGFIEDIQPFTGSLASYAVWDPASTKIEKANGGNGTDILQDNALKNSLYGGSNNDFLYSGYYGGDDQADGGSGNDFIYGYQTNNTSTAGSGDDLLIDFGNSNDTYKFGRGFGLDTIEDSGGSDVADLSAYANTDVITAWLIDYDGNGFADSYALEYNDGNFLAVLYSVDESTGGPTQYDIETYKASNGTFMSPLGSAGTATTQNLETASADKQADIKSKLPSPQALKDAKEKGKAPPKPDKQTQEAIKKAKTKDQK